MRIEDEYSKKKKKKSVLLRWNRIELGETKLNLQPISRRWRVDVVVVVVVM